MRPPYPRIWRSQGESQLTETIRGSAYSHDALSALVAQLPAGDWLGLHVRLGWPRSEAVRLGFDIVDQIAEGVETLAPLADEINA